MILGWLTSKLAGPLFGGLLLLVSIYALMDGAANRAIIRQLRFDRAELGKLLDGTAADLGTCRANFANIDSKLDDQNRQIQGLADATALARMRTDAAMARIEAQSKGARDTAKAILALPKPTPADACVQAARLLRGAMP